MRSSDNERKYEVLHWLSPQKNPADNCFQDSFCFWPYLRERDVPICNVTSSMCRPLFPTTLYTCTTRRSTFYFRTTTMRDLTHPILSVIINWYTAVHSCTMNLSQVCSWFLANVSTYFCLIWEYTVSVHWWLPDMKINRLHSKIRKRVTFGTSKMYDVYNLS